MLLINVTNVTNSPYPLACNFVTTLSDRTFDRLSYLVSSSVVAQMYLSIQCVPMIGTLSYSNGPTQ